MFSILKYLFYLSFILISIIGCDFKSERELFNRCDRLSKLKNIKSKTYETLFNDNVYSLLKYKDCLVYIKKNKVVAIEVIIKSTVSYSDIYRTIK